MSSAANRVDMVLHDGIYSPVVEYGHCHCGCGGKTKVYKWTSTRLGWSKGEPHKFLPGHQNKLTGRIYIIEDRGYETPCWIWIKGRSHEYGHIVVDGKVKQAHVVFYEDKYGPVPEGLELHHKCGNKPCINPEHMDPVTHAENCRISWDSKIGIYS